MLTLQVSAQNPDSLTTQRLEQNQQGGTRSIRELALLVHVALQRSDFTPLRQHIPTKQVYDKLMQLGSAPVREGLLLYPPDQIENDLQKDFSRLVRNGLVLEINWAEAKVKSITADTNQVHNAAIVPVKMLVTSYDLPPVPITFNATRLNGKYYYLGPLQIPDKDLNTQQRKYKR